MFSGKNKKNILSVLAAKLAQRVVKVNKSPLLYFSQSLRTQAIQVNFYFSESRNLVTAVWLGEQKIIFNELVYCFFFL